MAGKVVVPFTPKNVGNSLDRLSRNFLWGTSDNRRELHLVGWDNRLRSQKEKVALGYLGPRAATSPSLATLPGEPMRMADLGPGL
ncbi:hypothetical protein CRG98_009467 [Punica granatum]|uniref:Uncharacterized protein n=1 Tax=Punica granatum TaxID=22663 RepID=A0A2I0KNS5_PUNGR|nr:hypothetical protein CRG98_009467 [Punica granatum]